MSDIRHGQCHCGAVQFEVALEDGLGTLRRCNCSLCRRKGAVMGFVPAERFQVLKGAEMLSLYQWNTGVAKHYFCKVCGIYTHHNRRSDPSVVGFNVACLDGVDPFTLGDVVVADGASHSVADKS